jgi:hypothetical protein
MGGYFFMREKGISAVCRAQVHKDINPKKYFETGKTQPEKFKRIFSV